MGMAMTMPDQEAMRLRALQLCKVLDTPPERDFDRLVFIAAQAFRTPIAAIALVDSARVWFKAKVGISMSEIRRGDCFAGHVIEAGELTIFEEAEMSVRFLRHPLWRGAPRVRFYAGAPLLGPFAQPVGALGVMDRRSRSLTPEQRALLASLASEASDLLLQRVPPGA